MQAYARIMQGIGFILSIPADATTPYLAKTPTNGFTGSIFVLAFNPFTATRPSRSTKHKQWPCLGRGRKTSFWGTFVALPCLEKKEYDVMIGPSYREP